MEVEYFKQVINPYILLLKHLTIGASALLTG